MSRIVDKQSHSEVTKDNVKRRTFLKRASAGAVLTSLPAHSVWGAVCSLSGAQSGNMSGIQRHSDCDKPSLFGGRSPGTWKNLADFHSNKLQGVFNHVPNPNEGDAADATRGCYMQAIKNVADANVMVRPESEALINSSFVNNIYAALGSNGGGNGSLEYNLAGVWLNVYFGLYNEAWARNANQASAIVEQFIAYVVIQNKAGSGDTILKSDYGFDDGNTDFLITDAECAVIVVNDPNVDSDQDTACVPHGNSGNCD
jgi:hypothetical protein